MRTARVEKRIAEAVATVRRLNFRLVARGNYGVRYSARGWQPSLADTREVCICGAIALAENPQNGDDIVRAVARKLGITVVQAASLSDGFEAHPGFTGSGCYEVDKTWYRIGRKWRRRADEVRECVGAWWGGGAPT